MPTMDFLNTMSLTDAAFCLVLGIAGYTVTLVVYRLWLSPLSGFPGSPLAKTTFLYEFYYDWIKPGLYCKKIHEMHQKYGPVIQVTPEELHVDDPAYFAKLFVSGGVRKSDAYPGFTRGTGFEDYTDMIRTHDIHRFIRAPAQQFFSRSSLKQVEGRLVGCIKTLCQRLEEYKDTGKPVNMSNALYSLSTDAVSAAICEKPTNYLADLDFNATWFKIQKKGMANVPLFGIFPWPARGLIMQLVLYVSSFLPVVKAYQPPRQEDIKAELRTPNLVSDAFGGTQRAEAPKEQFGRDIYDRAGQLLQQSGIYQLSHTVQAIITHLALDDNACQMLKSEIAAFLERKPESAICWQDLEKLPYLDACVREGLRMVTGALKRSTRVFPDTAIHVDGLMIPKGTPVAMTSYWMHMDSKVFPDPDKFEPQRWLDEHNEAMAEYFVPFGRGSRDCLGRK
ncbi:uncharacterized protein APUU_22196A [Aspergillus puulaauensis]|uniref:Cytochrome P450 n=1 Tax=Aspergillus puulaauensis TaxID=1220207 RepID=A0A7R7XJH2_9EURO|nr:uncharacterized protein APUU_22196A [Aspergillus puulaauensis]BCS21764.1 hypothetical protein APUU_22196A [Aspergillus puulaauensis]